MPDAFYVPDGDLLVPTQLTVGPWEAGAQHGGPPSALVGRAFERCEPREGWRVGRVTVEILSPIPLQPLCLQAAVVRPGRSVELLEASLAVAGGREVARARAWRLRTSELGVAVDDGPAPPPGPEEGSSGPFFPGAPEVGYHTAMDIRFLEGGFDEPGPARAWLRMRQPLVPGEEPTPLQRVLVAADVGSGIGSSLDFRRFVFINTDLTVQLVRAVDGAWVLVEARTLLGPDGVGLTESAIGDRRGRAGQATQTLLVRRRPGAH